MPRRDDIKKVMIIGSGPIVIGQACEFDYSGTQACKALSQLGYEIVLVNSNPATIMTDPGMANVTYIEPLNFKRMKEIIKKERPDALLPNLGGQSGLNLSSELAREGVLEEYGVKIIGVKRLRELLMILVIRWFCAPLIPWVAGGAAMYTTSRNCAPLSAEAWRLVSWARCWWRSRFLDGKSWSLKWCAMPRTR
jgi:hypothetical protein